LKTRANQLIRIIEKPNDQNGGLTNKMYLEVSEEFDSPDRCQCVYETVLGLRRRLWRLSKGLLKARIKRFIMSLLNSDHIFETGFRF